MDGYVSHGINGGSDRFERSASRGKPLPSISPSPHKKRCPGRGRRHGVVDSIVDGRFASAAFRLLQFWRSLVLLHPSYHLRTMATRLRLHSTPLGSSTERGMRTREDRNAQATVFRFSHLNRESSSGPQEGSFDFLNSSQFRSGKQARVRANLGGISPCLGSQIPRFMDRWRCATSLASSGGTPYNHAF